MEMLLPHTINTIFANIYKFFFVLEFGKREKTVSNLNITIKRICSIYKIYELLIEIHKACIEKKTKNCQ